MEGFQIGAVQMNPRIDDLEHNLATHVRLIHEAADAGCRLVVFPELSVTAHYGDEKMVQFAEASDRGRIFNTMHSQAREQEIVVAMDSQRLPTAHFTILTLWWDHRG